jgi:hypothetical protein
MALVRGMAVSVVDVVDVIAVGHGDMPAAFAVDVVVVGVLGVRIGGALVVVILVQGVEMPVVRVVDVVAVRDGDVATAVAVDVRMVAMFDVGSHECSSCACRIVSLTM